MSPLSRDPDKRTKQLANLRPAPPAPVGHVRSLRHGGRAEELYRDVSGEVRELLDLLADAAPVRDGDGELPAADAIAVERAARALARYRRLSGWCDAHGRLDERSGEVKPAAEYELRAERALAEALDALGMSPTSRAKLGVDLARAASSAEDAVATAAARERLDVRAADVIDADAIEDDR